MTSTPRTPMMIALFAATFAVAPAWAADTTTITTTVTTSSSGKVAAYTAKPTIAIPNAKLVQPKAKPAHTPAPVATIDSWPQPKDDMEMRAPTPKVLPPLYHRPIVTIVAEGGAGPSGFAFSGASQANETSSSTGYRGELLAEIGRGVLSFQTGLFYQREGVTTQSENSLNNIGVDEFGIPLMAKFNLKGERQRRFTIRVGAIPIYASNLVESSTALSNGQQLDGYSGTDNLRSVNVLAEAGVGMEFPVGGENDFRIEVVYDHSGLPVNQDATQMQVYSQSVMLLIGFGLGT